ncbi:DUF6624 domain-containing protein [Niveibacterium sp. SC-1]|uniref:DUF6624 domain-containing protein n=1 Tax=Niveibacterium sp. SC-1 TaxID=3135646 RepID=UPI00312029EC
MLSEIRDALLAMQDRDRSVSAQLAADGTLFGGYAPRMEAVHRENATALRRLIELYGWPHEGLVGKDGAEAAWLVAQHAIGEPAFMRRCRDLLAQEAVADRIPQWQHAYLDDRIRVFEGKSQRFGTQFELTPQGAVLCVTEAPESLDERRKQIGLGPVSDRLRALAHEPRPSEQEYASRKAAEAAWRVSVGWTDGGAA